MRSRRRTDQDMLSIAHSESNIHCVVVLHVCVCVGKPKKEEDIKKQPGGYRPPIPQGPPTCQPRKKSSQIVVDSNLL